MAVTNPTRPNTAGGAPGQPRSGFRPSSRSRVRIAVGTLLSLVAVGVILLVFSTADKRIAVLQVVNDVPAGSQIADSDLRSIELSADPSLPIVKAGDIATVVGKYAKVRIISGGLVSPAMLQSTPVVSPGAAVVAVNVGAGELPLGMRERSQVQIVIPSSDAANAPPIVGRVVGLPVGADSVSGQRSVSLEVALADAATVASAANVRLVLLDPGVDPAAGVTP